MEIERKYLVRQIPENLSQYHCQKIAQGYLCTSPVVRILRSNDDYYLTYKGKGLLAREEYNLPLTQESYEHFHNLFGKEIKIANAGNLWIDFIPFDSNKGTA